MKKLAFKDYVFSLEYKKVKYLRFKITAEAEFKISAPKHCSQNFILNFLEKNEAWIEKQYKNILQAKRQLKADEIQFLGKIYHLVFKPHCLKLYFDKNTIIASNQAQVETFLRLSSEKIFAFYIKKWQNHFEKRVQKISIKTMKSLWGSCNHRLGHIHLNLKLIHLPLKAIEYVILHELNHLKFPHHQASFYEHLQALMPDFRQREALLKKVIFHFF